MACLHSRLRILFQFLLTLHLQLFPHLQVSATDADGPLNNAITYSLVEGDQLGHFTIHPKKGELQVAKALDWEQVSLGGRWPTRAHPSRNLVMLQTQKANCHST